MWLPDKFYELLPYLYVIGGMNGTKLSPGGTIVNR
jgi:hypothetical protein